MNIVLIGMRGSGKSTVAKLLAKRLDKRYVELDEEIAKSAQIGIADMVAKNGWDYFRDRESEAVESAAAMDNVVISTGGGVVLREKNVEALKRNGTFIYLKAPIDVLYAHIGGDSSKLPRLTDQSSMREELEEVLKIRQPLYEKAADEIINTEGVKPEAVADSILRKLEERHIQ